MDKWLPSRKIVLFLSVLIIFLIGLFYIFLNKENNLISYKKEKNELIKENIIKKISNEDSDGDGLNNWEENLWKTDINNPDTDGDGTNDNDEILENRNPLVKGPNDFLEDNIFSQKKEKFKYKKLTTTDKISRELLLGYLNLKKENLLTSENQEKLINNIIKNNFIESKNEKYSIFDLNIEKDEKKEFLKKYGNEIINIFKKENDVEDDLIIFKKVVNNENKEELNKLNINILFYKEIIKDLLEIKTPEKMSLLHLEIINSFEKIIKNLESMNLFFKDPINAIDNLNKYTENKKNILKKLNGIIDYLKNEV